jgi:hypothetical protein
MAEQMEKGYHQLLNSWVNGAIRSHAYIMGVKQLKAFVKGVSEVIAETFAEQVNGGIDKIKGAKDIPGAIAAYADLESASGILSKGHTALEMKGEEIMLTYSDCPYATPCSEILGELVSGGQLDKERFPCIRADVSLAAAKINSGKKGSYEIIQYSTGENCKIKLIIL